MYKRSQFHSRLHLVTYSCMSMHVGLRVLAPSLPSFGARRRTSDTRCRRYNGAVRRNGLVVPCSAIVGRELCVCAWMQVRGHANIRACHVLGRLTPSGGSVVPAARVRGRLPTLGARLMSPQSVARPPHWGPHPSWHGHELARRSELCACTMPNLFGPGASPRGA